PGVSGGGRSDETLLKAIRPREHFLGSAVQCGMRRSLWLLVLLLGSAFTGQSAGLIIVHDPDFWRPPPDNVPPHTLPIPRPHPTPPERWYRPPQPVWAPLEVAFVQASASIKEQIAT